MILSHELLFTGMIHYRGILYILLKLIILHVFVDNLFAKFS